MSQSKTKQQRRYLRQAVRKMWGEWWDQVAAQNLWWRLNLAFELVTLLEYRRDKRREKTLRDGEIRLVPKWKRRHRKYTKNLRGKR